MRHKFLLKIFIAISLILAFAFMASAGIFFFTFDRFVQEEYRVLSEEKHEVIAEGVKSVLDDVKHSIKELAHNRLLIQAVSQERDVSMQDILNRELANVLEKAAWRLEQRNVRISIRISGKNGYSFTNIADSAPLWQDLGSQAWWVELLGLKDSELVFSTTRSSTQPYPYNFHVIKPIRTVIRQETVGVIIFSISEKVLFDVYRSAVEDGKNIIIIDDEQKVVSSRDKNLVGLKYDLLTDWPKDLAICTSISGTDWYLYEIFKEETLRDTSLTYLLRYIEFVSLIMIGFIGLVFIVTFSLTKPIREINEDILKVRDGDYSVRTKVYNQDEIGLIAGNFNKMCASIEDMIEQRSDQEKIRSQLEVSMLRAQINPHFIYNTLNSVRFLIDMGKTEEASESLLLFTKLLKYSLSETDEYISLGEEIKQLKNYVDLQKVRYPEEFTFCLDVPEADQCYLIPSFILQPLVENAIMHGMKQGEKLKIKVTSAIKNDQLIIQVIDNGQGMSQELLTQIENDYLESTSIGIRNVKDRIRLYCSEGADFKVASELGKGTTITLVLDLTIYEGKQYG